MQWAAVLFGTLSVLVLALTLALCNESAQRVLAHWIGVIASRRGLIIRMEGLRGNPPWRFSIDEISIDDRDGRWLTARQIEADAELLPLLARRVELHGVTVRSLDLARLPEVGPPPDDDPPPRLTVDVGELRVAELRLGARLLGRDEAARPATNSPGSDASWSTAIAARGSGKYLIREKVLRGSFTFDAPDGTGLLPPDLAVRSGALHATAVLDGHIIRPEGEVVLVVNGVTYGSTSAQEVKLRLRGRPAEGQGIDEERAYEVAVDSTWTNLRVSEYLDGLLGSTLNLSSSASIAPHGKSIEIANVALESAALALKSAGRIEDGQRLIVPRLNLRVADVTRLGPEVREWAAGGVLDVNGDFTSDFERRALTLNVAGRASELRMHDVGLDALIGQRPTVTARVEVQGDDGPARLSDLHFEAAKADLTATGSMQHGQLDGEAGLELQDLADLSAIVGTQLAGALRLETTVSGPLDKPMIEAVLVPRDVAVAGGPPFGGTIEIRAENLREVPTGNVHGALQSGYGAMEAGSDFTLRPGESLVLTGIALRAKGAEVSGAATVDLKSKLVAGDLAGDFSNLQALSPFVGGRIQGNGTVRLSMAASDQQAATVAARLNDLRYESRVRVDVENLEVDAQLRGLRGELGGTVQLAAKDLLLGDVSVARVDFDAQGSSGSFDARAGVEGRYMQAFRARSTAAVDLRGDKVSVRVQTLEGEIGGRPLRFQRELLIAAIGGGLSVEQLDLALADARVRGSFRTVEGKLDGGFEVVSLPLDLAELVDPSVDLTGVLSGNVSFAGTADRPDIPFSFVSDAVGVGSMVKGELPPVAVHAAGRWGDQGFVADASLEGGGAGRFDIHAELPPGDGRIAVDLQGTANAALLNGLGVMGEDRVSGVLEVSVRIVGTASSPGITGDVRLRDGSYENAAIGAVLRKLDAHLVGEGTRLRLEQFEATDGDNGRAHLVGFIDFADGFADTAYVLDASLVSMKVARLDELSAQAGGDFHIEGKGSSPNITGSVEVERAEIAVPERVPADIVVFENVIEKNVSAARPDRFAPIEPHATLPMQLDLKIRLPGRVFVRGSDLDTEWQGQFDLRGTSAKPLLDGKLKLVRGSFQLLNIRLKATEGTITFDGGEKIDPVLDWTGEAKKNDIEAKVNVSGRASNLKVKFTSDPALPEDEILARLLFGKDPGQLSPVQSVQMAAAVARLSGKGGVGLDPLGWVRRTLRFDTVDVTTADTSAASSQVSVGKYVAENVFVRLNKGLTDTTSSAAVDVEITRNLSIESKVGSDQTGSLGLSWKWNY